MVSMNHVIPGVFKHETVFFGLLVYRPGGQGPMVGVTLHELQYSSLRCS